MGKGILLAEELKKMVSNAVYDSAVDIYNEGNGNFTALFADGNVLKIEADYEEVKIFKTSLTVNQKTGEFIEGECDCTVAKKNGLCKHIVSLAILSDSTEKVSELIGTDIYEMFFEDDFEKREIVKIDKRLARIEEARARNSSLKSRKENEKNSGDESEAAAENIVFGEQAENNYATEKERRERLEMSYQEEKNRETGILVNKVRFFSQEDAKKEQESDEKQEFKLELEIEEESYSDYRYGYDYEKEKERLGYILRIKSGADKTYYIKDIAKFVNSVILDEKYEITGKVCYSPRKNYFSETDRKIIGAIGKYLDEINGVMESGIKDKKGLKLNPMLYNRMLGKAVKGKKLSILGSEVRVTDKYEPLFIEDGDRIVFRELDRISGESRFFQFRDDRTKIYKMKKKEYFFLKKFGDSDINFFNSMPVEENRLLKSLITDRGIEIAEYTDELGEVGIYVQEAENREYIEISLSSSVQSIKKDSKYYMPKKNKALIEELEDTLKNLSAINHEDSEHRNRIFVVDYDGFSRFSEIVDLKYRDKVRIFFDKGIKKARNITVSIDVKKNKGELLTINFDIEGIKPEEVEIVLEGIKNEKKYITLSTGELVKIANKSVEEMLGIVDSVSNLKIGKNKISKVKALQLAQISKSVRDSLDEIGEFKSLFRKIKEKREFDPSNLKVKLFPYQKIGFNWLKNMYDIGFGAILADDMGLGKTLQTVSLLNEIWNENKKVLALVIVPTSLLHNWKEEIVKFSSMKPILIEGVSKSRKEIIEKTEKGLLITTYQALRNDIEEYRNKNFDILILDEAQNIKTPTSQIKKAVMKLNSKVNFALTGTPVENNVLELWSIFDFVLPGYLDNLAKFKKSYKDVLVNPNSKKIENLRSIISPFLLRRTKKEVLTELPEKIETDVVVELNSEQKQLYLSYVKKAKKEISKFNKKENNRMKILAILTKLRQICNSPKLFKEDYNGEVAKIEVLRDLMPDIVENEHRVLIFSQFVGTLKEIEEELKKQKIDYFYIDGSVKSKERMEISKKFNEGERQAVLISLKAGGTGLNLIGADVVIHYDPWWNIAVENQASDRAYRIGQKNSVQIIKLVTEGTIEEKIIKIQENKKVLSDNLLEGNDGEKILFDMSDEELMNLLG